MIFEKMSIHNKIVVQETNTNLLTEICEFPKISTLDKSIILSYLID